VASAGGGQNSNRIIFSTSISQQKPVRKERGYLRVHWAYLKAQRGAQIFNPRPNTPHI